MSDREAFLLQILKQIAEAAVVIAAFLFVAGWSYIFGYFSGFGIGPGDLNFAVQTTLVYSIPVIKALPWWFEVSFVIIYLIASLATIKWPNLQQIGSRAGLVTLLLIVVPLLGTWLSYFASSVGRDKASRDRVMETSALPSIQLIPILESRYPENQTGCDPRSWQKLLLHGNGSYYIVDPFQNGKKDELTGLLKVCIFPDSQFRAARLQVGTENR